MKELNMTSLRGALRQLPTHELDKMLREELEKEYPDQITVRLIIATLEDREEDEPIEIDTSVEAAWEKYQEQSETKPARKRGRVLRAAVIAMIVGLLLITVPQAAEARNLFKILTNWTDSVFMIFRSDADRNQYEYEFRTDNPGLQEVYDAVVEMEITEPVVPMWLPEGYELAECEYIYTQSKDGIHACFVYEKAEAIIKIIKKDQITTSEYFKDKRELETKELNGTTYNIMRNSDRWVVVWTIDNIECFLTMDCQEDVLEKILESIYVMEDNE